MPARKLFVGLIVLSSLAALLIGIRDSNTRRSNTAGLPLAGTTPPARPASGPQAGYSDADLQAGLLALCANDARDPAEEAATQAYEAAIRTASERLAVSSSAEHLLAAALLQTDSTSRVDLIERAVSAAPADPLALWSAVRICSASSDSPGCPLRVWEQRLIAVDGQNSESWWRVASNRYAAGDKNAALEAMRFASTAAESRIYWTETIESIERALRAVGDIDFPERANSAFGVAAASLPSYSGLTEMCAEESSENSEWADVCLKYGELVENQGKTYISVGIALAVQRRVLEAMGEVDRAAAVEERIRAASRDWADATSSLLETAGQLLFESSTLFYAYLAAIRSEGEVAAQRGIAADIERLIRQRPELACEQVR